MIAKRRAPTSRHLRRSALIGMWKDRDDIKDSAVFARQLREEAQTRNDRFAKTRKAIQAAIENPIPNLPSDEELDKKLTELIDRLRKNQPPKDLTDEVINAEVKAVRKARTKQRRM